MESNDILNGPIPSHGGGIGKTFEESILTLIPFISIQKNMINKDNYAFFIEKGTHYIGVVSPGHQLYFTGNKEITYSEVINGSRYYKHLEVLNILPINEDYCLVELIDPEILKEHMSTQKALMLERR